MVGFRGPYTPVLNPTDPHGTCCICGGVGMKATSGDCVGPVLEGWAIGRACWYAIPSIYQTSSSNLKFCDWSESTIPPDMVAAWAAKFGGGQL